MGLVNKVVPCEKLEETVNNWCQEILSLSPTAVKFCKLAFNAETDHMFGFEGWAHAAVRMFWGTEEASEAKKSFAEKRKADFSKFR
jgi:naphthoate synthase